MYYLYKQPGFLVKVLLLLKLTMLCMLCHVYPWGPNARIQAPSIVYGAPQAPTRATKPATAW